MTTIHIDPITAFDFDTAECILFDISNGLTPAEAVANAIIMEMAIPYNSNVDVVEIFNAMMEVSIKTNTEANEHTWDIDEGFLFCDTRCVRVCIDHD